MKENFDVCLTMLLKHEGGYVNHPKDPGGETNLGVTRAVYEQHLGRQVMEGEMKTLTISNVAPIYKEMYWDKLKGDMLPSGLDWALFDWGVNSGTGRAAKAIQKIVGCKADGAIGPMTLQAIQLYGVDELVEKLYKVRQDFYESLSTFDTFGKGWSRRNKETLDKALQMI